MLVSSSVLTVPAPADSRQGQLQRHGSLQQLRRAQADTSSVIFCEGLAACLRLVLRQVRHD